MISIDEVLELAIRLLERARRAEQERDKLQHELDELNKQKSLKDI